MQGGLTSGSGGEQGRELAKYGAGSMGSPLARVTLPNASGREPMMIIRRERAALAAMATLRAMGADPRPTHRLRNGLGYIAPDTGVEHGPATGAPSPDTARYTVHSAYSGTTYASGVDLAGAMDWAKGYECETATPLGAIAALSVGETWKTHTDARGLVVRRIA